MMVTRFLVTDVHLIVELENHLGHVLLQDKVVSMHAETHLLTHGMTLPLKNVTMVMTMPLITGMVVLVA